MCASPHLGPDGWGSSTASHASLLLITVGIVPSSISAVRAWVRVESMVDESPRPFVYLSSDPNIARFICFSERALLLLSRELEAPS